MKTKIYESYADFLNREDKTINGVSEDFASEHPDFEKDNETNVGCWNCYDCKYCEFCENSYNCMFCISCVSCVSCYDCISLNRANFVSRAKRTNV